MSFGQAGGKWIALEKLYGSKPSANYAIDEIGDIGSPPTSLVGDYSVNGATVPNCSVWTRDNMHGRFIRRDDYQRYEGSCRNTSPGEVALF